MKILWFVNVIMPNFAVSVGADANGSGGWMSGLLSALRQYAPNVELGIAFRYDPPCTKKINGVAYYALGSGGGALARNAERCLKEFSPDVVHIHGAEEIAQQLPDSVFSFAPTVLSIQGILEGVYANWFGGLGEDVFKKYSNPLLPLLGFKSQHERHLECRRDRISGEKRVCSKIRNFIGRTNYDKVWVENRFPQAQYYKCNESLRNPFYAPVNRSHINKHTIFCSSAMTYPLKGGHLLIEAFAEVVRRFPDARLRVPNATRIPPTWNMRRRMVRDAYPRYLWHLVKKFHLKGNIDFLPTLSAEGVCQELDRADIFCLSSLNENSPNSLCEAQMRGVPCVAFNVGGVPTFIEDGKTGVFAKTTDASSLADAMIKMLEAKDKEDMGLRGYEAARQRHGRETIVRELVNVYRAVGTELLVRV